MRAMDEQDKPFHYLTQEQFLALSPSARLEYLRRVTDHLEVRAALMKKADKPKQADS